jgi:phosphinothricin acetyltransferase
MITEIRTAKEDDLPSIVKIYNQAIKAGGATGDMMEFSVDERRDWFRQFSPESFPAFVAVEDDVVVGYIYLSPYRPGRMAFADVAEVSFFVDYDRQGKGVGRAMMIHMLDHAMLIHKRTLIAILLEVNEPSVALLESFEFSRWGYLPLIGSFNGELIGQYIYGRQLK